MAITNINFNNVDYVKASGKRIITCSSNSIGQAGVFNYRFYLEVTISGTVYSYTFRPNNDNYGFINITKILQSFIKDVGDVQQTNTVPELAPPSSTTAQFKQNIHSMPHRLSVTGNDDITSTNSDTFRVTLELFDFYGDTADAVPYKRTSGSQSAYLFVISGYDTESDLINVDYSNYYLDGTTKKILNNNQNYDGTRYIINCSATDWGTISMFKPTTFNTQDVEYAIVKYYNYSGGFIGFANFIVNTSTAQTDGLIITAGMYPQNINKLGSGYNKPSDYGTNLNYYDVYLSDNIFSLGTQKSAIYRFVLTHDDECQKYDRQRFAYINNFGVWEYISFNEIRRDNISSKPTSIKGSVYNYQGNYANITAGNIYYRELGYVPRVAHRGEKTVATDFSETFTVNTGYLNNSDIAKIQEMFLSHKISYINTDGSARAVILENSSLDAINNTNKHYEQVSYTLTFRYSVPTYNNIIF